MPYLVSVDSATGLIVITSSTDRKAVQTQKNIRKVVATYSAHGRKVKTIVTDSEGVFLASADFMGELGIRHIACTPNRHACVAERSIKTIKEHFRATQLDLEFNLPSLYPALAEFVVSNLSILPNSKRSDGRSAREIVTGLKPNFKKAMRVAFGQFVHAAKANVTKSVAMVSRVDEGIVIGRNIDTRAIKLWLIPRMEVVWRDAIQPQPMSALVVQFINARAEQERSSFGDIPPVTTQKDMRGVENRDVFENPIEDPNYGGDENNQPETQPEASRDIIPLMVSEQDIEIASSRDNASASPQTLLQPQEDFHETSTTEAPSRNDDNHNEDVAEDVEQPRRYPVRSNRTSWLQFNKKQLAMATLQLEEPIGDTMTMSQALASFPNETKEATRSELQQMINFKVFKPIRSRDAVGNSQQLPTVPSTMILKRKASGSMKARLVVGGHRQELLPRSSTESPTIATETVMLMLSVSAHQQRHIRVVDVKGAYLNANLVNKRPMVLSKNVSDVQCEIDSSYSSYRRENGSLVVELQKALYGLQESAQLWYKTLRAALESFGYVATHEDQCLFNKSTQNAVSVGRCSR